MMNSSNNRKLLLSYLRNGDYAHVGEEKAIELAMAQIPQKKEQLLLDVGCGLGGTADYLEKANWGTVIGVDINANVIDFAKKKYPSISFIQSNVQDLDTLYKSKFDVIYSFNAFFCFASQFKSLEAMAYAAKADAQLMLFDYSSTGVYTKDNPFSKQCNSTTEIFSPINKLTIQDQLASSGWRLKAMIDITQEFMDWYRAFLSKMRENKSKLTFLFSEITYKEIYESYSNLVELLQGNEIGGTIIYATREPEFTFSR